MVRPIAPKNLNICSTDAREKHSERTLGWYAAASGCKPRTHSLELDHSDGPQASIERASPTSSGVTSSTKIGVIPIPRRRGNFWPIRCRLVSAKEATANGCDLESIAG